MKKKTKEKLMNNNFVRVRNLWELFLIYSIMGWIYEVIWCNLIEFNKGFINNGFLFGPWLPIYGIGMSFIMALFLKFNIETPGKIFLYGALIATVAELIGSYFMQNIMGSWLWDYNKYFLNFEGRIAVRPSLYFGALILFGVYVLRPHVKALQEKYTNNKLRNILSTAIIIIFLIDTIYHLLNGSNL